MKKLFLMSSSKLLPKALESLHKPLNKIRLVHVITASKTEDDLTYLDRTRDILDSLGVRHEDLDIDGKNEEELKKILSSKDVVFVNGGNTFYLLKSIKKTGFDKVVKLLLKKGLLYIGASAGSYVACPNIETVTWKHGSEERCGMTDFTAMNLVPFVLKVHYTPDQKEWIEKKRKTLSNPLEILTDEQAIVVENNKYYKIPRKH